MQKPSKPPHREIKHLSHLALALIEGGAGISEAMNGTMGGGSTACAYCSGLAKRPIYH
jgi:hypothetical protein